VRPKIVDLEKDFINSYDYHSTSAKTLLAQIARSDTILDFPYYSLQQIAKTMHGPPAAEQTQAVESKPG